MNQTSLAFRLIALATILVVPLAVEAQQAGKVPQVGVVHIGGPGLESEVQGLRDGLRELGHVDGQAISIAVRSGDGDRERYAASVAEFLRLGVDVIVTTDTISSLAAKQATNSTPIVFVGPADPIRAGLVASYARPGGNLTGITRDAHIEQGAKMMQLLKEAFPRVSRVAVLWNPGNPAEPPYFDTMHTAAPRLGLRLRSVEVRSKDDLVEAFAAIIRDRSDALIAFDNAPNYVNQREILDFAAKQRMPALYGDRQYVAGGGLMSYGAHYGMKGSKPSDLPVEQPTHIYLVINLKTAKALGLTIPSAVLARADEVIQ
jgi:ABC-type uncharacterized transport system substrate-binding protein